jgi:hypothetical protein
MELELSNIGKCIPLVRLDDCLQWGKLRSEAEVGKRSTGHRAKTPPLARKAIVALESASLEGLVYGCSSDGHEPADRIGVHDPEARASLQIAGLGQQTHQHGGGKTINAVRFKAPPEIRKMRRNHNWHMGDGNLPPRAGQQSRPSEKTSSNPNERQFTA